jgi:hypothetical protein
MRRDAETQGVSVDGDLYLLKLFLQFQWVSSCFGEIIIVLLFPLVNSNI